MLTKKDKARIVASVETLGETLLSWRLKARLSKTDAARQCGISPQHWWALENDKRPNPEMDTLEKLAAGTAIAVDTLLVASAYTRKARDASRRAEPVPAFG